MIDRLVQTVRESRKYGTVCEEVVRNIGLRELKARGSLKEAVKATKNMLHQIAGAYLDHRAHYDEWLSALAAAQAEGAAPFRQACRQIMERHASTRERLACLEPFYAVTLADVQPVRSVLDIACGLNPLALSWMPLAPDAPYYACDIYEDMAAFLNGFFALAGVPGRAAAGDVIASPPAQSVHVALILKFLPLLEQVDRAAALPFLRAIRAEHLLVSFPTRTLGGRNRRMAENYEARFRALIQAEGWRCRRYEFDRELCFRVTKP